MSLYTLLKNHCIIIKSPINNKLIIECVYCGKSIYDTCRFDWEKWNSDMLVTFEILESKITYHLIFKCKTTKRNRK